jgi:V/A-type H+-transporting ATPase subunit C
MNGFAPGKIKEVLIPSGELDRVFLDRLLAEDSPERMVEMMRGKRLYPVLARELPAAMQSGNLSHLENVLVREFYADLIELAKSGIKGGALFLNWILLDIDITNIRGLFRLRVDDIEEDARDLMVPGATFSAEELQQLNAIKDQNEFIDALLGRIRMKPLRDLLETTREKRPIGEIEIGLIRVQLDQMEKMAKLNPFSIHPILEYLERKRYEVFNLRAIARGKEAKLPSEQIQGFLVI